MTVRHGHAARSKARSPEYAAWMDMRSRCLSKSNHFFHVYGGRGITICDRWSDFPVFLADMGRRPSAKHSLDRIDVNGPYSPDNCRWASRDTQNNNRQNTIRVTYQGVTMSVRQWERELGLSHGTLKSRLDREWPLHKAMTLPSMGRGGPRQTHCKRGHPLVEGNVRITSQGARLCMICDRARTRDWKRKNRR